MSLFDHNLDRLRRRWPDLADRVAATAARARTLTATTELRDAATTAGADREAVRGWLATGAQNWAVLGLADAGAAALELRRQLPPTALLLVIEPNLTALTVACARSNLAPLLDTPHTQLIVESALPRIGQLVFEALFSNLADDLAVARPYSAARTPAHAGLLDAITQEIAAAMQRYLVNRRTTERYGPRFAFNMLRNIPRYPGARVVSELGNGDDSGNALRPLAGTPAIIAAAGPSLADSLPELARVRDRALLIACDSCWPPLLAAGIAPDLVASIDIHARKSAIYRHVRRRHPDHKPPALWLPYAHPRLTHAWDGPRVWGGVTAPITRWMRQFTGRLPAWPEALSVAHSAFYLARHLGCDPIVLVGLDLALTDDHHTHVPGTLGTWASHEREVDAARRQAHHLTIPGLDGKRWPTVPQMAAMASTLESVFAETSARIVNATVRGAALRGADRATLGEALPRTTTLPAHARHHALIDALPILPVPRTRAKAITAVAALTRDTERVRAAVERAPDPVAVLAGNPTTDLLLQPALARLIEARQAADRGDRAGHAFHVRTAVLESCQLFARTLGRVNQELKRGTPRSGGPRPA